MLKAGSVQCSLIIRPLGSTVTHQSLQQKLYYNRLGKVKVKQSRYRPGVAQRVPGS